MNILIKLAEYFCLVWELSNVNALCNNQLPSLIIPIFSTKFFASLNVYLKKIAN